MAFLVELREKLRSLPRPQLLTIVAAQNPQDFFFMNRLELEIVLELVDFINVKTYDYYGTWSYLTGPPGPLFDGLPPGQLQSSEGKYVDWTMRYYGCRTSQLNKVKKE
jgi:GH18 family chitinase